MPLHVPVSVARAGGPGGSAERQIPADVNLARGRCGRATRADTLVGMSNTLVEAPTLAAVAAVDLVKIYGAGHTAVRALDGVTVGFARGAFTAIMGPSGSGKSTLMHCLAGLDTATSMEETLLAAPSESWT